MLNIKPVPLVQFLTESGDGLGEINAFSDFSLQRVSFSITPAKGEVFVIHRIIIAVEDDGGTLDSGSYGNGIALVNGIEISSTINENKTLLAGGYPIKTNAEWGRVAYDVDRKSWGSGNEFLLSRLSFDRFINPGIVLEGNTGDKIEFSFQENFSSLISHTFLAQGQVLNIRGGKFSDYKGKL